MENNRAYVGVDLFKGDYCPKLSPDFLEIRESQTQTDDESISECSVNSANTIILNVSNKSTSAEESTTEDEETLVEPLTPVKSSVQTRIENPGTSYSSIPLESLEILSNHEVIPLSPTSTICDKDSTNFTEASSPKPQRYKKNIRNDVIPLSPAHTISSRDSTSSDEEYSPIARNSQKSKKKRTYDSDDESSDERSKNTKRTVQSRPKKNKSSKPPVNGKKRIVMNRVVYPSSFPTSSEDSSSDYQPNVSKKTRLNSLTSKILADKSKQKNSSDVIEVSEDDS